MDTNIDNYSEIEIAKILNIEPYSISIDILYDSVINKLTTSENSELDTNEKQELLVFFKNCFIKLCEKHNLSCSKKMIASIEKFVPLSFGDALVIYPLLYPGSLPETTPQDLSFNTYSSKYNRGLVNPLKRETIIHTLIINNKLKDYNTSSSKPNSSFSVNLSNRFTNVISLKVASLEFQNSVFNISEQYNNNSFVIETYKRNISTNDKIDVTRRTIKIPYGCYNIILFSSQIVKILNDDNKLSMIEFNYMNLTNKCNFKLKVNPPIPPGSGYKWEFNIYFDKLVTPKYMNIGWFLGFNEYDYLFEKNYNKTSTFSNIVGFNTERCVDFTHTKFFLLAVDDYNKNAPQVIEYITNKEISYSTADIIAKIPNFTETNEIMFEDSSDRIFKTRRYFGPINLQKIHISILDEFGNVINNNGGDIVITFEVELLDSPYKNMIH